MGRINASFHRLIARYRTIPNNAPGAQLHNTEGAAISEIRRQSVSAYISESAAKHTSPPIPATKPPTTGNGMNRIGLASRKHPIKRMHALVITAPVMSVTTPCEDQDESAPE